ncbi:MAG: hypothetical protein OEO79_09420 [Gemmatimonadota bacterium]|nr:hypothetical protein [Gemmatimonadota bacterium]MDH3424398.1 hypothetical protein [Gemmatimonadota bacterium]
MTRRADRAAHGAAAGDVLIFLATLSIAAALLYPAWSTREFRATVEEAVADVETLSAAARVERDRRNRWPTPAPPGEAPPELSGLGQADGIFDRLGYTLGWASWDVVDSVDAPPSTDAPAFDADPVAAEATPMVPVIRRVGAVTVHSGDESLLAELLEKYSGRTSFVLDTMWLLVLPERAESVAPSR